jgi:hypothetical protein
MLAMLVKTLTMIRSTQATSMKLPIMPRIRPAFARPSPPSVPPLARIRLRELLPRKKATGPSIERQQVRLRSPKTSERVAWLSVGRLATAYPGAAP